VNVLALDTTTRAGSCAISRGDGAARVLAGDPSSPHDARLPGELISLLEAEGFSLSDVDLFAVATGPGSFTGLRVGIATMQGLSFACGRPLVGVSAMDALARIASETLKDEAPLVAPWVDAWRGEIYASLYHDGELVEPVTVEHPEVVLRRLTGREVAFIGDGAEIYADFIRRMLPRSRIVAPTSPPIALAIAMLARERALRGDAPGPDAIRPLYVRRSDAELSRDGRA
jgi:tRNA threonylcarbamoyladenosine biosynthesis protein TsaB